MSLQLNQPAASADDLQESLRAMMIVVSLIIDQIEQSELMQRGHFSKILGLIDEITLQKAAGEHPAGGARLALGLIDTMDAPPRARWRPDANAAAPAGYANTRAAF